jgi:hypothetical protein
MFSAVLSFINRKYRPYESFLDDQQFDRGVLFLPFYMLVSPQIHVRLDLRKPIDGTLATQNEGGSYELFSKAFLP